MYGNAAYGTRPYADIEAIYGLADGNAAATATFDYVIYAATREFATLPTDGVLPSRPFRGTLTIPLQFRRSILGNDIGTFTTGDGSTQINNADGSYDFLPQTYSADGRPIEIKVLKLGDDYGTAFTIFKGVMGSWFIDETTVAIDLRDFSYKLDVAAQPNLYGGTGGLDGGSDLAQKPKPVGVGRPLNVPATLIDAQNLVYQVHDGAIVAIPQVCDRGATLVRDPDYPTYAALIAASIPEAHYATCIALGIFRLYSPPQGQVTADFITAIDTSADAVRFFVERATDLRYASDFYTASFENVNSAQSAPIDFWLGVDSTATVASVGASIMRGIGGWAGFRRNGLFEIRRFVAPSNNLTMSFSRADILDIKRSAPPSALTPPAFRQRVPYQLNWTVQESDLAGVVTADRRTFLAAANRLAEDSSAAIKTDHPFAKDAAAVVSFFRNAVDAQAEATRLLNLYRVERALYQITLRRKALYLNLGDTISVSYPRFDISQGRLMKVVEISEDLSRGDGKIDTVLVTAYG